MLFSIMNKEMCFMGLTLFYFFILGKYWIYNFKSILSSDNMCVEII